MGLPEVEPLVLLCAQEQQLTVLHRRFLVQDEHQVQAQDSQVGS